MTKDEALKMAVEALESIELLCNDNRWYLIGNARKACKEALEQPAQGEIVVTKNDAGQIVMVSRQDSEGNILSVIAESENT